MTYAVHYQRRANMRMCGGKNRYATKPGYDRGKDGFKLRAYLCPICDGWHLTKRLFALTCVSALTK